MVQPCLYVVTGPFSRLTRSRCTRRWFFWRIVSAATQAIVTVLVMQVVDYVKANDAPSLGGVAGVSEAVAHAQNFFCEL